MQAFIFFFFNATATTEIYTLSLHDALPISKAAGASATARSITHSRVSPFPPYGRKGETDRKSTRLNSSHMSISYAVFCLKKKKKSLNKRRKIAQIDTVLIESSLCVWYDNIS